MLLKNRFSAPIFVFGPGVACPADERSRRPEVRLWTRSAIRSLTIRRHRTHPNHRGVRGWGKYTPRTDPMDSSDETREANRTRSNKQVLSVEHRELVDQLAEP